MEKEIQHLLDQDIIEKVNEPVGWVSPPVVTPEKDQSQIRLNVDMCVANKVIPLSEPNDSSDMEQRWAICDQPQRRAMIPKHAIYNV